MKEDEIAITANDDSMSAVKKALKKISNKQRQTEKYNAYYKGKHPLLFASEKFSTEFAQRLQKFSDNLCKTVVKAPCDRLEVTGFSDRKDQKMFDESWSIWNYSKMPQMSKRIHREAFKQGDAYVVVWADAAGKARMWPQKAENCTVWYDDETGEVERGAKLWRGLDKHFYLTIYYRDRIEKFISANPQESGDIPVEPGSFLVRNIEGEAWPVPNDFGVCPLLHFGLENSILDDVIPLNDALNKEVADMLIGSEANSLRQRWVSGISYEKDPETGKGIVPFDRDSQYAMSSKEGAKFGEFQDASLTEFLAVINDFRKEIARVSGIPAYYFMLETGSFPSGEALTKAEARFSAMIAEAQLDFGVTWSEAMRLAMQIDGLSSETAVVETKWTPAAPMSETEKLNIAVMKKQVGVSNRQILAELGYTEADIIRMEGENADDANAALERQQKLFDAGNTAPA